IITGNGDGTFKAIQSIPIAGFATAVATGDVNGDGINDLIAGDYTNNQVNVFLGNGSAQIAVAPTLGTFSLLSRQDSLRALTQFGTVLNRLTASIGKIGANESRLQTVNNVLSESHVNFDNAASQIQDVDVAQESATLVRTQILQQAGASILAQANQQPALALR